MVTQLREGRLGGRLTAAKCKKADEVLIEKDFRSDETMEPMRTNMERAAQQTDRSLIGGSTNENDGTGRMALEVLDPASRKLHPGRRRIDADFRPVSTSSDVTLGSELEIFNGDVLKPSPHFGLPLTIEVLHGRLKARFSRRSEYRNDSKAKRDSHDSAHDITMLMGALKDGVVIELSVMRQAEQPPVIENELKGDRRGDGRSRPAGDQASVKGDAIEDLYVGSASDNKACNRIEAIELRKRLGHFGQIPTERRRRSANARTGIEHATTMEYATDRSDRRNNCNTLSEHLCTDGTVAEFSERAGLPKLLTNTQDRFFDLRRCAIDRMCRTARTITPVHTVQAFSSGTLYPALNGVECDSKLDGYAAQRTPASKRSYSVMSELFTRTFLDIGNLEMS